MRTRTALAAAALTAGTILGLNADYPCTGGGCATTDQQLTHPCNGGDCLTAHPCNGAECRKPNEPASRLS
ncbi:hypothetical protein [Actinocrispum sp. NPDC049592]|uniref:hypothetical protein n=1 Tax=Actinocrispum sp. NPDC049592 TaxID=3154835 RepID=UPI00343E3963